MSVFESLERFPVEYLPTGDKALVMAWWKSQYDVVAVLCLEDGTAKSATLDQFRFDYRYDNNNERWVDVSRVADGPLPEGDDAESDQASGDHGREEVPGRVPETDGASEGDPSNES